MVGSAMPQSSKGAVGGLLPSPPLHPSLLALGVEDWLPGFQTLREAREKLGIHLALTAEPFGRLAQLLDHHLLFFALWVDAVKSTFVNHEKNLTTLLLVVGCPISGIATIRSNLSPPSDSNENTFEPPSNGTSHPRNLLILQSENFSSSSTLHSPRISLGGSNWSSACTKVMVLEITKRSRAKVCIFWGY